MIKHALKLAGPGRMAVLLTLVMVGVAARANQEKDLQWTTTWGTATENIVSGFWMSKGYFPPKPLENNTIRMFLRTSMGGERVRFRFSNVYGKNPVEIKHVHFALAASVDSSAKDGDIKPETDTALRFKGRSGIVIPPGETVCSDPVKFSLPDLALMAVSIHYGKIDDDPVTGHRGSRTTSFFADGNAVSNADMAGAEKKDVWYTLVGIEVMAPKESKTIIAYGDSITDGNGTHYNYNTRWTDFLAARLVENKATAKVGVANMGIGGSGVSMAKERFERDVLDQSGAGWLVMFIGVNDIVYGKRPASDLINAYTEMAKRAHEKGIKVYGATITPMANAANADQEAVRQEVNAWIRTTAVSNGIFDACIDFDATMRDPDNPAKTLPAYAKDDLHMNPVGYKAMGESIDLDLFVDP